MEANEEGGMGSCEVPVYLFQEYQSDSEDSDEGYNSQESSLRTSGLIQGDSDPKNGVLCPGRNPFTYSIEDQTPNPNCACSLI